MKRPNTYYSWVNIYYALIPFLLLYIIICIFFAQEMQDGDEGRYLWFANNLLKGFYSPPFPNINLWNGPGYPLVLTPFVVFGLPLIACRLLNAFFLYFSLVFSYKTICIYSSKKTAFFYTITLGLYFPVFEMIPLILSESLAWFLISLVCFLFMKNYKQKTLSWNLTVYTAFSIAFLAMTKVIFGYVILLMFFISISMFLSPRHRPLAIKSTLLFFISFVFCLPWLIYTYMLTSKIFYWSNSGGMSLYTMSSPYPDETGDWKSSGVLQLNPNHKNFMDRISKLNEMQRNEAYQVAAIENIKNHPEKYIKNWIANVGRLLFSYPYSNATQNIKTYFTIIPNMFVVVLVVLAFIISILHYEKFPGGLILLFLFITIYIGGSTLISAYRRMFYITMPFWGIFISFVFTKVISLTIKRD